MSDSVYEIGIIAEFEKPLTIEQVDEFDEDSGWRVNNEGTLVFNAINSTYDPYELGIVIFSDVNKQVNNAETCPYAIKTETARHYYLVWYDGSDHPFYETTLADYQENK